MEVSERTIKSLVSKFNDIHRFLIVDSDKPKMHNKFRLMKKEIQKMERKLKVETNK